MLGEREKEGGREERGEGRGAGKESEGMEGEWNPSWQRLEVGCDLGRKPNEGPAALVSLLLNSKKENKVVFIVRTQERKLNPDSGRPRSVASPSTKQTQPTYS